MSLNTLDLFCGAGGFSLGMSRAGLNPVAGIDFEQTALKAYRRNLDEFAVPADLSYITDNRRTASDLLDLADLSPEDVDVVVGGPPCQGFSRSGNRDEDDDLNDLVWSFMAVVAAGKPRGFIMENVPGLRTHRDGETLEALVECAEGLGYNVDHEILNASNFEVPQERRRLFLMGIQASEGEPRFPSPVGETVTVHDVLYVANGRLPDNDWTNHADSTIEDIKELEQGESLHGKYHQVRLKQEEPARTIKASNRHIHPTQNRELTIRECAVLQSFPPDYSFVGTRGERTRQVGNAVPPKLAEHLGKSFLKALGEPVDLPTDAVGMSMRELADFSGRLTEREVEAILLRSAGLTWAQVGNEMGISRKTAANLQYRAEDKVETAKNTIEMFERLTNYGD